MELLTIIILSCNYSQKVTVFPQYKYIYTSFLAVLYILRNTLLIFILHFIFFLLLCLI